MEIIKIRDHIQTENFLELNTVLTFQKDTAKIIVKLFILLIQIALLKYKKIKGYVALDNKIIEWI